MLKLSRNNQNIKMFGVPPNTLPLVIYIRIFCYCVLLQHVIQNNCRWVWWCFLMEWSTCWRSRFFLFLIYQNYLVALRLDCISYHELRTTQYTLYICYCPSGSHEYSVKTFLALTITYRQTREILAWALSEEILCCVSYDSHAPLPLLDIFYKYKYLPQTLCAVSHYTI